MLEIKNLNQAYGGSHILRDVSLALPEGQVSVLLGRNGVGKTTLLRAIMGVVPIRSGQILLNGQAIEKLPPEKRVAAGIGYVPQGREIFARLTVEENLRMGLASRGRHARLPDEIFELFPVLLSMLRRRGGDLSGGQQQQLAIGRALAADPRVLILDEPTEGIQPSVIKDIGRVIRHLADSRGMTILLVEQYYDFAEALADHYAVMTRGEIVRRGDGASMARDNVRDLVAI
ncbi:MAG: urea ABC transporter ATP-binding subunit UrtE [Burkholderiaceae bacterium]